VDLMRRAIVHNLQIGGWKEWVDCKGAAKLEVVATIAGPIIVSHEKSFVNFSKYFRAHRRPINSLQLQNELR
jgi:hypothetical protein